MIFLGIDTSNYACSAAVYDDANGEFICMKRSDLPVKPGNLGLRQSDAVFHHTRLLPEIIGAVFKKVNPSSITSIAVSGTPTGQTGSYMPCFVSGVSAAQMIGSSLGVPIYTANHQVGHILAATYGCKEQTLYNSEFYAVHLSGGTTDVVFCDCLNESPGIKPLTGSTDLHAGQCIDRIGKLLGLDFPAGKQLSELAIKSSKIIKPGVSMVKDGCSLSGLQNKCEQLFGRGESAETIARFCLESIAETIYKLSKLYCVKPLPIVMSGGVSSSVIIKEYLLKRDKRFIFAPPRFCCDNAAGIAVYAARVHKGA